MLRIRLRRVGKKKQPMYRIVVADSRAPRDGRFVEAIGQYHPLEEPSRIVLDEERVRHWLDKGAQPSDRVSKILAIQGIAEIPEKLKSRMALGEQRRSEASAKAEAEAKAGAEASMEAPSEAPATAEAAGEASSDAAVDEAKADAGAEAEPVGEASAEPEAAQTSESTDASAEEAEASKE